MTETPANRPGHEPPRSAGRADRAAVIVGVGQINERPDPDTPGSTPVDLMAQALKAADRDGGGGWLARFDQLSLVCQVSFPDITDAPEAVVRALGIKAPPTLDETESPGGTSAVHLLNKAANRIAAGEAQVVAIVGGEAFRSAARRPGGGNAFVDSVKRFSKPAGLQDRYGLVTPTEIYPLYENACRAKWGQTLSEGQAESAEIWSLMSKAAETNPAAAIRRQLPPDEILTITAQNRPIAFPYSKLMVANNAVNQAAGMIVTSLATALAAGVPEERLIYVGRGAAAHEPRDPLRRESYDRSRSLEVSIEGALALNGITRADLAHVELYSCFPCVPKLARRVLDWPLDRPVSVYGGLTFGGAPVGNAMGHAIVRMVETLRGDGSTGLIFGNSGFATSNHSIVLSRKPAHAGPGPQRYDLQDQVHGTSPHLLESYQGPARLETYTVVYRRNGTPDYGVILGRTPHGARFLSRVPAEDGATLDFLTSGAVEPVGTAGTVRTDAHGYDIWQRA